MSPAISAMINKEDEIMKAIYSLEILIKRLEEYKNKSVKTVGIEIDEEGNNIKITSDGNDISPLPPIMIPVVMR